MLKPKCNKIAQIVIYVYKVHFDEAALPLYPFASQY